MGSISDNLKKVLEQIAAAAEKSGRSPEEIKPVAVTTMVGVEAILESVSWDVAVIEENRV